MEILSDPDLIATLPEPKLLLEGFKRLTEQKFFLIKRGRLLKQKTFRYFTFTNDSLTYFLTNVSTKEKGRIPLQRAIAVPFRSMRSDYAYCIKVISFTAAEFFIFPNDDEEFELMMIYIKLSSNNMLQPVLDKICFNAIDEEYQALSSLKTPKNLRLDGYLTPKNVISRFLFSPTSENNFDLPDENLSLKLPVSLRINEKEPLRIIYEDETLIENQDLGTEKIPYLQLGGLPEYSVLENATTDEIRAHGSNYLWNYQLEYAKLTFESISHRDMRSGLYIVEGTLFRLLITGRKSDIKNSMEQIENFEKVSATIKDEYSEIFHAELMLLKSIVLVITGQKFKAFINLRSCWKVYKRYENTEIEDRDIKARVEMGLGVFLLLISLSPVSVSTILRLAGFSSNRAAGLAHLWRCYDLMESRSVYAGIILSLYYVDIEPDLIKSVKIIELLSEKYAGCVLLHWVSSIISWKSNQLDLAIDFLNRALRYCGPELSSQAAFIKYELGWFYFLKFEWTLARTQFESILLDTLSLSSELDSIVKNLLIHSKLTQKNSELLETLQKSKKHKKKSNWLDSDNTPDRVYLPHKCCLITQLVSCMPALSENNECWLRIIKITAMLSQSKSNMDEDFGRLSESFLQRKSTRLMAFEVIYFMKQHTKLLPHMLERIFVTANEVAIGCNKDDVGFLAEYCSAEMLQIMALALNGETGSALRICRDVVEYIDLLPVWASYIAPHALYWCGRVMIAEGMKPEAEKLLKKAKRYKKYIFDIKSKIERVINELI